MLAGTFCAIGKNFNGITFVRSLERNSDGISQTLPRRLLILLKGDIPYSFAPFFLLWFIQIGVADEYIRYIYMYWGNVLMINNHNCYNNLVQRRRIHKVGRP